MGKATYRDLAEFGLPLVTPDQAEFRPLVDDIEKRPQPFASWPVDDLNNAAVLLNQSGNAILGLSYVWRRLTAVATPHTSRYSNLGSSIQLDVLTGRSGVTRDIGTFILPGSKRLITERGMFGNNLDVLEEGEAPRGGGYMGAGGGAAIPVDEELAAIELILDAAILEDGRCVGPDEFAIFESVGNHLEQIRRTAEQGAAALRNGASAGEIFELLRPLARHTPAQSPSPFLRMFADMGIRQLINHESDALAAWFDTQAQPPRLRLYRPSA